MSITIDEARDLLSAIPPKVDYMSTQARMNRNDAIRDKIIEMRLRRLEREGGGPSFWNKTLVEKLKMGLVPYKRTRGLLSMIDRGRSPMADPIGTSVSARYSRRRGRKSRSRRRSRSRSRRRRSRSRRRRRSRRRSRKSKRRKSVNIKRRRPKRFNAILKRMFPGDAYHGFRKDGTPIFSKWLEYEYSKRAAKKIMRTNVLYRHAAAAYKKKYPKKDLDKLSDKELMEEALRLVAFWEEVNKESENFSPASWEEVRDAIEEFYEEDQMTFLKDVYARKSQKSHENFRRDIKKLFKWMTN